MNALSSVRHADGLPIEGQRSVLGILGCWLDRIDRAEDGPASDRSDRSDRPPARWEDDEHVYFEATLPDIPAQDVEVSVHDGRIMIRIEKRRPANEGVAPEETTTNPPFEMAKRGGAARGRHARLLSGPHRRNRRAAGSPLSIGAGMTPPWANGGGSTGRRLARAQGRLWLAVTHQEVSERKRMKKEFGRGGAQRQGVLDDVQAAIFLKDLDGRYLMINRRFAELFGVTKQGVVGKTDYDFLPKHVADALSANDQSALAAGMPMQVEEVAPHGDGLHTWIVIKVPLLGPDGAPYAVCGIATDITARKGAEAALRERVGPAQLLRKRPDGPGRRRGVRRRGPDHLGQRDPDPAAGPPRRGGQAERPAGEPDIPAEHTRRWLDAYRQARGSGHTARFELTGETADGPGWFAFTVNPIADEPEGRPRFCVVVEDITASERVKRALRDSEEQVRLLLDSTGEAICGVDLDGRCTFCNTACLRLLGYSDTRDLLGKNLHGQIHHSRADGTPYPLEECRILQACRQGEQTHVEDEVLWRADRTSFPAEYWTHPVRQGGEVVGVVVTFVDITERRRVEQELRDSAEHLRVLSRRVDKVQEEERRHLSRELHDEIGQALTTVGLSLQTLKRSCDADALPHLEECIRIVDRTIGQVRYLSLELPPSMLDYLSLVAALR